MQLHFRTYELELKNTFRISHDSRDFQPALIVELQDHQFTGYGEAAATSYYGVTTEKMIKALQKVEPVISKISATEPAKLWKKTFPLLENDLFALCALDMAAHDLYAQKKNLPLYKLWKLDLANAPVTSYTIGLDEPERMVQKIKEFPWPFYKLKLGSSHDLEIVRELRKHTDSVFRVDVNKAWNADEAIKNSFELKKLNVEFIEQPLKVDDIEGMKILYKESALPIFADESCCKEQDVEICAQYFHGVNIKLTKCGGLTPAKRMIEKAKDLNLQVMLGCMTESSIGISAVAHLAPLADFLDIDGAMLLNNDIASGVRLSKNGIEFPERNGTGAKLLMN